MDPTLCDPPVPPPMHVKRYAAALSV